MNLEQLKKDCTKKQKKGIHFILASIVIWTMVLMDLCQVLGHNFLHIF